ncbi:MAG TPA: hypothetical protein VGP64_08750, partial [Polyangia bacterium]
MPWRHGVACLALLALGCGGTSGASGSGGHAGTGPGGAVGTGDGSGGDASGAAGSTGSGGNGASAGRGGGAGSAGLSGSAGAGGAGVGRWVMGYWAVWQTTQYPLAHVAWADLTHAAIAFVEPRAPVATSSTSPYATLDSSNAVSNLGATGMSDFAAAA